MKTPKNVNWNVSPAEAREIQKQLADQVVKRRDFGPVKLVGGVDVGFEEANTIARAAAVVLTFPELRPVAAAVARRPVTFPYVPGLLAFRELPVVLDALEELEREPDLVIVDGHGYSHPRRFGIACYLGVLLDKPSIGCAKSILVGKAEMPDNVVGAQTPLVEKGETIGAALRTRLKTNPVYVSIGHRVDLETACRFVLGCCKGYRVPETTRYAHNVAGGAVLKLGASNGPEPLL